MKDLKAVVPSPVLKACLDDMALDSVHSSGFVDSDDEEQQDSEASSPKSSTPYSGSLSFKGGKTSNTTLYYVDYKQMPNNGNGLEGEEKCKLYSDLAQAKERLDLLKTSIQTAKATTAKLLSEPTNEEATTKLVKDEALLESLREEVENARQLKVNEHTKHQLKRRIDHMAAEWRKRRRICVEFLHSMEECTEGTVSTRKCLDGDGQIEIESDECALKSATAFAKSRKKKSTIKKGTKSSSNSFAAQPSASFVGVKLDSSKGLVRVHLDDF